MRMYIKAGNVKYNYNGNDIKSTYQLVDGKDYSLRKGIDSLFVIPLDVEKKTLVKNERNPNDETIMGRVCDKIVHQLDEEGIITSNIYWFDTEIYSNPDNYRNVKFSFKNVYISEAQSPWLQFIYDGNSFSIKYTATKIEEKALDDSEFRLPNLPQKNGF
ncbi:MAG: hypothetical protein ACKVTZ_10230 [Bacteroidia bacterium]